MLYEIAMQMQIEHIVYFYLPLAFRSEKIFKKDERFMIIHIVNKLLHGFRLS